MWPVNKTIYQSCEYLYGCKFDATILPPWLIITKHFWVSVRLFKYNTAMVLAD